MAMATVVMVPAALDRCQHRPLLRKAHRGSRLLAPLSDAKKLCDVECTSSPFGIELLSVRRRGCRSLACACVCVTHCPRCHICCCCLLLSPAVSCCLLLSAAVSCCLALSACWCPSLRLCLLHTAGAHGAAAGHSAGERRTSRCSVDDLVRPEGAAFDCGAMKPGHTLVAVNDRSLLTLCMQECARIIAEAAQKVKESHTAASCKAVSRRAVSHTGCRWMPWMCASACASTRMCRSHRRRGAAHARCSSLMPSVCSWRRHWKSRTSWRQFMLARMRL